MLKNPKIGDHFRTSQS